MKLQELCDTNSSGESITVLLYCEEDNTNAEYDIMDIYNHKAPKEWCNADVDYWDMNGTDLIVSVMNKPVVKASKRIAKRPIKCTKVTCSTADDFKDAHDSLMVCEYCLQEIQSHEGRQKYMPVDFWEYEEYCDEDGMLPCDWCDEYVEELYEL